MACHHSVPDGSLSVTSHLLPDILIWAQSERLSWPMSVRSTAIGRPTGSADVTGCDLRILVHRSASLEACSCALAATAVMDAPMAAKNLVLGYCRRGSDQLLNTTME
jgi:hypothetical protein